MSHIVVQLTDNEFKNILKDAYVQGAKDAKELLLQKEVSNWVSEAKACKLLGIKANTLKQYRHNRKIDYRGTRGNMEYSIKSISQILEERTVKKVI